MTENQSRAKLIRRPFRILSLDGGGVRAVMQAVILDRLVKMYPNLLSEVDLFTGASAGAIVSSALCLGIPPGETVKFYEDEVGKIFTEGILNRITTVGNTIGACYNNSELRAMLSKEFGNKTLADLSQKLLIPTFKLDATVQTHEYHQETVQTRRWAPEFLHNFPNSRNSSTPLIDAVLRTTAAPTYFPVYQGYVDGGVVANNPSMIALTTAMQHGVLPQDVVIFSISTGCNPKFVSKEQLGEGNWGLFEWGTKIIDLLLDSSTEAIDYQCRCLLNDRYQRLDPVLPADIGLDNAKAIAQLKEIANNVDLTGTQEWLEKYWFSKLPYEDTGLLDSIEYLKIDDNESEADKIIPNTPENWRCNIQ